MQDKFTKKDKDTMHGEMEKFMTDILFDAKDSEKEISLASFEAGYLMAMTVFKEEIMKARGNK